MRISKDYLIWAILIILILIFTLLNLTVGEYQISFKDSLLALFNIGSDSDISIIRNVRLPRTLTALFVGATLSLSGIFTQTALKNPLADSSILGIQSGATTFALIIILIFPMMYLLVPLAAFIGGLLAFSLVMLASKTTKKNYSSLILSGVAINAFFTSIIGLITMLNANQIQSALLYLNGSLVNITSSESTFVVIVSIILISCSFLFISVLKLLKLDDVTILNLGKNPSKYRLFANIYGVLLASISVCFVGIISFIGIIIPSIAYKLCDKSIKHHMITSCLLGALVILSADFIQRIIFNPIEVPVGLIIGLISAPLFIVILRRSQR